jgi:hypothetical protein
MANPNVPHKIAILLKYKVHETLPDGMCAVPAIEQKSTVFVIEGNNKEEVMVKLNTLIENLKVWTR